jgi:hypothetical protein
MKIAKADKADMEAAMELTSILDTVSNGYSLEDDEGETFFDPDDREHLRMFYDKVMDCVVRQPSGINRVVWGGIALIDGPYIDQESNSLALSPRISRLLEADERLATRKTILDPQ